MLARSGVGQRRKAGDAAAVQHPSAYVQLSLPGIAEDWPGRAATYPRLRYMGSKHRLLPWISAELRGLSFHTSLDAFSGSGAVSYLMKCLGKAVTSNDFLLFAHHLTVGAVQNSKHKIGSSVLNALLASHRGSEEGFILQTFRGIFFSPDDLKFLDDVWLNMPALKNEEQKAIVISALVRSCLKRQPRGVFSVSGDPEHYKDGRRDLRMSLREHFVESLEVFNELVFDNGQKSTSLCGDVFELPGEYDLVYMDPPYVPRADDNCYIKRYHFLEGLASNWKAPGTEVLWDTKVHKIPKRFTPFSYRKTAIEAFGRLFEKFRSSILILSYSSNGYPDLEVLVKLMRSFKSRIRVRERDHKYHFGTHDRVSDSRTQVREYLIIGE